MSSHCKYCGHECSSVSSLISNTCEQYPDGSNKGKHEPCTAKQLKSFSELIEEYDFSIPSYQRAYSWTEKQVSLFIADLAEHAQSMTQYYLGHYILESKSNLERVDGRIPADIVDGQQRLTTVAIFLAVCRSLSNTHNFRNLRLSVVEYDRERFDEILIPDTLKILAIQEEFQEATASLERVVFAIQTFYKSFFGKQNKPSLLSIEKIDAYLDVISNAAVSVGVYKSKAVAAQIFELHNTRGVLLTETEKVKALLMKYVYLNNMEEDVAAIQDSFAKVFKLEEKAALVSFRGEMTIDDILAHHLRAVDGGKKRESYTQPQSVEGENGCVNYVRKKLEEFDNNRQEGVIYAKNLASEFAKSMNLVSVIFVKQDEKEPLIGDVILLDQRRSMIFLLRYFRAFDAENISADNTLLRRWESFLFLWDCHDVFYNMKADKKDSFAKIFDRIQDSHTEVSKMLQDYYLGNENFAYRKYKRESNNGEIASISGLAAIFGDYIERLNDHLLHRAYTWGHWHGRYKYLLYKYEIEMTEGNVDQVRSSLRGLFKENDVTLDHIVPHELEWKELSENGAKDDNKENWDSDDRDQAESIWKEIQKSIDGIGNLVILSRSSNSSLQNMSPIIRSAEYKNLGLVSISYQEVSTWKPRNQWVDKEKDSWQAKIKERGLRLLTKMNAYFTAQRTWNDE